MNDWIMWNVVVFNLHRAKSVMLLIRLFIYFEFFSLCGVAQADSYVSSAHAGGQCCFVTLLCHYLAKVGDHIGLLRSVQFNGNIVDGSIISRGEQLSCLVGFFNSSILWIIWQKGKLLLNCFSENSFLYSKD